MKTYYLWYFESILNTSSWAMSQRARAERILVVDNVFGGPQTAFDGLVCSTIAAENMKTTLNMVVIVQNEGRGDAAEW